MAFQVSPGVNVTEKDLTNIVPSVATTVGGFAGYFKWGPAEEIVQVDSERNLISLFGTPDNANADYWWSAANFLAYGNDLRVVRKVPASAANAYARGTGLRGDTLQRHYFGPTGGANFAGATSGLQIKNEDDYFTTHLNGITLPNEGSAGLSGAAHIFFAAKYAGDLGNSLLVSMSDATAQLVDGKVTTAIGGVTGVSADTVANGIYTKGNGQKVHFGTKYGAIQLAGGAVAGTKSPMKGEVAVGDKITLSGSGNDYTVVGFSGGVTSASKGGAPQTLGFTLGEAHENEAADYTDIIVSPNLEAADSGQGLTATVKWAYEGQFDRFPETSSDAAKFGLINDEVQIAVVDSKGKWSGTPGTVLERFEASKARDSRRFDGSSNYYVNVVNDRSKYIWWGDHPIDGMVQGGGVSGASDDTVIKWGDDFKAVEAQDGTQSAAGPTFDSLIRNFYSQMDGGADSGTGENLNSVSNNSGLYTNGYDLFQDSETVDCSLLIGGPAQSTLAGKLVDLAEARKDCVAFLSPLRADCVGTTALTTKVDDIVDYYNNTLNKSSSYGVFDSGWKYQYDNHNDVFRWVPLNGDVAGLCARTEFSNDAWFSPAGYNRGTISNVVKLAVNPRQAHRDKLYKNNINPVVSFPGEGTILFGDKTMQRKASAFDRINVRRLFIVLEKAISTAAKFFLFEFNDEFTRQQFKSTVEPFLRTVQGRRGITDFRVVCDESNNPGDVVDRNEFVADIFIKPARSINFIQLNFVAVRTDVAFEEIAGV